VRCTGTIRPGDYPLLQEPFRVMDTSAITPPNETRNPAVPAAVLDTVLDQVSVWLRQPAT
jgi:hypothetical protein